MGSGIQEEVQLVDGLQLAITRRIHLQLFRSSGHPTSKEIPVTACALCGGQGSPNDREVTAAHSYETQIRKFATASHLHEPSHLDSFGCAITRP